ncbi:hypothetical protein [Legionella sp. CNM-4043-24]|uniref:hypothetical protein n=1 Tax=Legionella sp. CNM-4043-24 TaxID=3421646 RepID=UPI00403AC80A
MKRWFSACFITALSGMAMAGDQLLFKQNLAPKISWMNYVVVLLLLIIGAVVIARKMKPVASGKSACQVVEKKYLGNKTVIYVLNYHNQQFLLADNQQALTLYPLTGGPHNEHD